MATYYFWDEIEDNVVREYDDNNNTLASYTTEPTRYGSVLSQDRGGETRIFQFDGLGNTTELTSPSGAVTDTRRYSAFGAVTESSGTTVTAFGFGGRWGYHSSSGASGGWPYDANYYVRRRHFGADISRWRSCDPLGVRNGLQQYLLVRNSPIARVDKSGLKCQPAKYEGANYVTGRGTFTLPLKKNVYPNVETASSDTVIVPIELWPAWTPIPKEFLSGKCCCCNQVNWVQAYKLDIDYSGPFGFPIELQLNTDWTLDGGMPYPGGDSGPGKPPKSTNPCLAPPTTIGTFDGPEAAKSYGLTDLVSAKWEYDLCVYCETGVEGPGIVGYRTEIGPTALKEIHEFGIVVYDCVKWNAWIKRESDGSYIAGGSVTQIGGGPGPGIQAAIIAKSLVLIYPHNL